MIKDLVQILMSKDANCEKNKDNLQDILEEIDYNKIFNAFLKTATGASSLKKKSNEIDFKQDSDIQIKGEYLNSHLHDGHLFILSKIVNLEESSKIKITKINLK